MDTRFKHGDVVMSYPQTSNWIKWVFVDNEAVMLDGYPSSEVGPTDPTIGVYNVQQKDIKHMGNIFEDPSLICAHYFKHKNKENFKLYLELIANHPN